MTNFTRSPFFYVGDKFKILKHITPYFPNSINRFIEPFTGGGSVFLNVKANEFLLNDIDKYVYQLHLFLLAHAKNPGQFLSEIENIIYLYDLSRSYKEDIVPVDLKKRYKKTYYSRYNKEKYNQLKYDFNNSDRLNFYQFYVLLIYGFNRMIRFNSSGQFNIPVGNVDLNRNVITSLIQYFEKVKDEIITVSNCDYKAFISTISFKDNDFIYLDPPYLITFSEYNKLWNEENELQLIRTLNQLHSSGVKFAISNVISYKDRTNHIFNNWSKDFNTVVIKSNYISYHDNSIKNFKEVLVTNYG